MDSVIMQVSCPGCSAVFELPAEVAGQAGECTECGTIFEIPTLEEMGISVPAQQAAPSPNETSTNLSKQAVGAGKELADTGETTNTIKLSRSSIGMVPDLSGKDDGFKVDIVQKPQTKTNIDIQAPSAGGGGGQRKFSKTRTSMSKRKRSGANEAEAPAAEAPAAEEAPKKKAKKPWWQFWMFWK